MKPVENPFSRVLYVMAKPAGSSCNLACDYCYYLEKKHRLPLANPRQSMSEEVLEEYTKQYINAQTRPEVCFTWHGGEAMMRPLEFYKRAMELQRKYSRGHQILNCLQTNGTLLTDEWCRFLKANNWLVGVSIDGPEEFHDRYRLTPAGKPTFRNVMRGIRLLQRYGVEWNAMAVVNDFNVDYPLEFYQFFKSIGCKFIQFTPIVERYNGNGHLATASEQGELTETSIDAERWGNFMITIFDEWVKNDVGDTYVQLFDAVLAGYVGVEPGICTLAPICGHAAMMEHNGDLYSCDHFAFNEYRLGNIMQNGIAEMMVSERQLRFGESKRDNLPPTCRSCKYLRLCNGECPKNRFAIDPTDGTQRLNYLCEGYRRFFEHTEPYFRFMADEYRAGRAPARVMTHFKP